ncbi:radical SAM family heme chaperone HemW [Thermoleptolyngbya sp. M55_K2018_002]|uniref:radical SAM family heme chaperone HemW n=1 Tax=Thermoleptolyngbya sp. M55_K2018_002 TaxID=2747808 RepID=UPI0019DB6EDF|nr:radical SAM family heme chaperone HemW [Thermoleptolyngbya sp. M55_K2018_002]HIK41874.1 coproporphyrinogen III oxidase [Thermoleptolyngbya sp. M55_K2018_002]
MAAQQIATVSPAASKAKPQDDFPTAAYLHIPFCRRRCFYCDFPISVVGDRARGETSGTIAQYVEVLEREILTTGQDGRSPLETVFFGGGTPSLLSVAQVDRLLTRLDRHFGIATQAEISMEMDPGTFDLSHVQGYRAAGVNRISLGVQSFQADSLQACGRTHRPEDIPLAVDLIRRAGLDNYSLDLISGLPHLTLERWQEDLDRAIALDPAHLSIYDLTVEPGTAFTQRYRPGEAPLPTDEATAQMYRLAQQVLTQRGFQHYEISNYARPGYSCRHNRVYWENRPYYGFGMGAASYVNHQRFSRPRTRREYFQWVETLEAAGGRLAHPTTPPQERLLDTLMLGLRLADGLDLLRLELEFGKGAIARILTCLQPHLQRGWVDQTPSRIRLTDPEGFLFSNVVLSDLFEALSESPV